MENASKALIMAGGVMLVMLIIALIIFAWGKFSEFYSSNEDLYEITDITEFNLQFTNYDRDDVMGYELISLANKVADYNNRYSSATGAKNDEGYTPITLTINFVSEDYRKNFVYSGTNRLFTSDKIEQSDVKNQIENIITTALGIEKLYGNSDMAAKVAKNINSLDYKKVMANNNMTENLAKESVIADFNALTGKNVTTYSDVTEYIGNNSDAIYKYYEYYQFKKGIFECTNITYDSVSGRVSKIEFKFTGKLE